VARERGIVAYANGTDWVSNLADRGYIVSKRPTVGAILSFRAFGRGYGVYGHVALVVDVDPDGRGFTIAEGNVLGVGLADVRWVPITDPAIEGFIP
jgi:surface antigen